MGYEPNSNGFPLRGGGSISVEGSSDSLVILAPDGVEHAIAKEHVAAFIRAVKAAAEYIGVEEWN